MTLQLPLFRDIKISDYKYRTEQPSEDFVKFKDDDGDCYHAWDLMRGKHYSVFEGRHFYGTFLNNIIHKNIEFFIFKDDMGGYVAFTEKNIPNDYNNVLIIDPDDKILFNMPCQAIKNLLGDILEDNSDDIGLPCDKNHKALAQAEIKQQQLKQERKEYIEYYLSNLKDNLNFHHKLMKEHFNKNKIVYTPQEEPEAGFNPEEYEIEDSFGWIEIFKVHKNCTIEELCYYRSNLITETYPSYGFDKFTPFPPMARKIDEYPDYFGHDFQESKGFWYKVTDRSCRGCGRYICKCDPLRESIPRPDFLSVPEFSYSKIDKAWYTKHIIYHDFTDRYFPGCYRGLIYKLRKKYRNDIERDQYQLQDSLAKAKQQFNENLEWIKEEWIKQIQRCDHF